MKKLLLVLSVFFASGSVAAAPLLRSEMASPCRHWTNAAGGSFKCASYAFNMWIPDARDVDRELDNLDYRVRQLEAQLVELQKALNTKAEK